MLLLMWQAITVSSCYPVALLEPAQALMLPCLGGAVLFPTLNMVSGNIQVPIAEKAKAKSSTESCLEYAIIQALSNT